MTLDVTAVLNAKLEQVFENARAIKVSVSPTAKAMEHPLETGATVTDHRILLPVMAELSLVLASTDYPAVYQQIAGMFKRGELLTVQTRVASFPSMIIEKMPHEETGDMFDAVAVALTLKEAQFVSAQYSSDKVLTPAKVKSPKDASTVGRGQQQPTPAKSSSILSRFFK